MPQFVVHDPGTLLNSTEWIANVKKWVTQINEMIDARGTAARPAKDRPVEGTQIIERAFADLLTTSPEQRLQLLPERRIELPLPEISQRVTVNLSLSTDLLFKVATVTSYFSMNSEGRMSFIEQVKNRWKKPPKRCVSLTNPCVPRSFYKSMKGHNRKTITGDGWPFTRHTIKAL